MRTSSGDRSFASVLKQYRKRPIGNTKGYDPHAKRKDLRTHSRNSRPEWKVYLDCNRSALASYRFRFWRSMAYLPLAGTFQRGRPGKIVKPEAVGKNSARIHVYRCLA